MYAGDNDISGGKTSEQVVVDAERLIIRLRAKLPDVRIVFIGVKPSIFAGFTWIACGSRTRCSAFSANATTESPMWTWMGR